MRTPSPAQSRAKSRRASEKKQAALDDSSCEKQQCCQRSFHSAERNGEQGSEKDINGRARWVRNLAVPAYYHEYTATAGK